MLLIGCRETEEQDDAQIYNETSRQCLSCHALDSDSNHRFDCLDCHLEDQSHEVAVENHLPVLSRPAAPSDAPQVCGGCHGAEIAMVSTNVHYRLRGHVELIRQAFGIDAGETSDDSLVSIASYDQPEDVSELVDDLLSRRCLRCHVYTPGDDFSAVTRGTGCAACHLIFEEGRMRTHQFTSPPADDRCLACHYGNHVGFDYHGKFEHDFNEEYRTPYFADTEHLRPYGVEARQLEQDIHQRAGMVCTDCHFKSNVMGSTNNPACIDCHQSAGGKTAAGGSLTDEERSAFTSGSTGREFIIPRLEHQAHTAYGKWFSCQACHARWTYNDSPTHLLRIDHEDFYDFYKLSLDGSSEVLRIISSHISDDGEFLEPTMSNKFSTSLERGIWFKGFGERRWETIQLVKDESKKFTTARPILNLRLSWIDEYEKVRFDNIEPIEGAARLRPYAAHTIGKAGLFYEKRIRPFLETINEIDSATESGPASAAR